jgi:hypothetical protein
MEPRKTPPEYFLEIFADTTTVRDVLERYGSTLNIRDFLTICTIPEL